MDEQTADGSAVMQVLALQPGQVFSRSRMIPADNISRESISKTRKTIINYLNPVVARAKQYDEGEREFRIHTTIGLTKEHDVIVTGVIEVIRYDGEI